jgi:hypothetical protein
MFLFQHHVLHQLCHRRGQGGFKLKLTTEQQTQWLRSLPSGSSEGKVLEFLLSMRQDIEIDMLRLRIPTAVPHGDLVDAVHYGTSSAVPADLVKLVQAADLLVEQERKEEAAAEAAHALRQRELVVEEVARASNATVEETISAMRLDKERKMKEERETMKRLLAENPSPPGTCQCQCH